MQRRCAQPERNTLIHICAQDPRTALLQRRRQHAAAAGRGDQAHGVQRGLNAGSASRPSLSMRAGRTTASIPQACSARAVPSPTLAHWAGPGRCKGSSRCAACTAAGLVNTAIGAPSACRSASRACGVSLICRRHGDTASNWPPCRATARRSGACSPLGRSDSRVQDVAVVRVWVISGLCESSTQTGSGRLLSMSSFAYGTSGPSADAVRVRRALPSKTLVSFRNYLQIL